MCTTQRSEYCEDFPSQESFRVVPESCYNATGVNLCIMPAQNASSLVNDALFYFFSLRYSERTALETTGACLGAKGIMKLEFVYLHMSSCNMLVLSESSQARSYICHIHLIMDCCCSHSMTSLLT